MTLLATSCDQAIIAENVEKQQINMLNLGDSYTFGQSVCDRCTFPSQLKDSLEKRTSLPVTYKSIAKTGWTTSDLINGINAAETDSLYDVVTLLIGVNNQYQNKEFKLYEEEFLMLLERSISYTGGDVNKVFVISIPDYAFTPFGQNSSNPNIISEEIDMYNQYAKIQTLQRGVQFINITDITRQGIENPDLVATDQLHPSALAYKKFVERLIDPISTLFN